MKFQAELLVAKYSFPTLGTALLPGKTDIVNNLRRENKSFSVSIKFDCNI